MNIIQTIFFTTLLLLTPLSSQAAPVCDPDNRALKVLDEMIKNSNYREMLRDNSDLSKHWGKKDVTPEALFRAWNIIKSDKALSKDPDTVFNLFFYIHSEHLSDAELKGLQQSFDSQKDGEARKKWLSLKYTKATLEAKYASMSQNPPPKLTPWSKEHKAQRWNNYKNKKGKKLSYAAWSNIYDGNINKSKRADEAAENYAKTLTGDVEREQTFRDKDGKTKDITIDLNGRTVTGKRQHDIIQKDEDTGSVTAIEVKDYRSGKVYLSEDIKREALMDVAIKKDNTNNINKIVWVFNSHGEGKGEPSGPLKKFLKDNGIEYIIK